MELTKILVNQEVTIKTKHFKPSEALNECNADFFSEDRCREWILKKLHPEGAYCPFCRNKITDETTLKNFWTLKRCVCKNCNKWFSATYNTIIHGSHLTMAQAFALAVFLALGIDNKQIAKIIGIHPESVRIWRSKFNAN